MVDTTPFGFIAFSNGRTETFALAPACIRYGSNTWIGQNHEPTKLLAPHLKAKIWSEDLDAESRIEF